jgi:hypothetical protein
MIIAVFSYVSACVFQYVANAAVTFAQPVADATQMLRYASAILAGLVVSTIFLAWIAPALHFPDLLSIVLVAVSIPVINFFLFSYWVYHKPILVPKSHLCIEQTETTSLRQPSDRGERTGPVRIQKAPMPSSPAASTSDKSRVC